MVSLAILDETTSGDRRAAGGLQLDGTTTTVREIVRLRVQQEVERFNRNESVVFRGLVQPEDSERILNGVRQKPVLDWEKQYDKAVTAFRGNGLLILVDDRQIMDLDEEIQLRPQTKVTFLKLVPLIGG